MPNKFRFSVCWIEAIRKGNLWKYPPDNNPIGNNLMFYSYITFISSTSTSIGGDEFHDHIMAVLAPLHDQYKVELETEHENKLALEMREIYCQLVQVRRNQAIILSKLNVLLAASAMGFPRCHRLIGLGQSMRLQRCKELRIDLGAVTTSCGAQPICSYQKKIILFLVMAGVCTHTRIVFIIFRLLISTVLPTVTFGTAYDSHHSNNLRLISEFQEVLVNDFDFEMKAQSAHKPLDLEQLNVLGDLVGRIQQPTSNSLGNVLQTERSEGHSPCRIQNRDTRDSASPSSWTGFGPSAHFIVSLFCIRHGEWPSFPRSFYFLSWMELSFAGRSSIALSLQYKPNQQHRVLQFFANLKNKNVGPSGPLGQSGRIYGRRVRPRHSANK